ncbi:hypothetical protein JK182_01450 [Acetobacter okinawensis]|uniref:LPD7 domain-containing protein n=1 Tax=Acetobacter okinawensis TaxID=1076594 RepID=UPI001BA5501D|nr:LPD7 domain-containing protein [Acetobacter okinawensis]MBS0987357.1 hypothetical protein [Acetobacter okinawensis]
MTNIYTDQYRYSRLSGGDSILNEKDQLFSKFAHSEFIKKYGSDVTRKQFLKVMQADEEHQNRSLYGKFEPLNKYRDYKNILMAYQNINSAKPDVSFSNVKNIKKPILKTENNRIEEDTSETTPFVLEDDENLIEPDFVDETDIENINFKQQLLAKKYKKGFDALDFDTTKQEISCKLPNGQTVIDTGDALKYKTKQPLDKASAIEMARLIQEKGWTSIKIKGSKQFKHMVALACLDLDPPVIVSNHKFPDATLKTHARQRALDIIARTGKELQPSDAKGFEDRALENCNRGKEWMKMLIEKLSAPVPTPEEIGLPKIETRKQKTQVCREDYEQLSMYARDYKRENGIKTVTNGPVRNQYRKIKKAVNNAKKKLDYVSRTENRDIYNIQKVSVLNSEAQAFAQNSLQDELQYLKQSLEVLTHAEMAIKADHMYTKLAFQKPVNQIAFEKLKAELLKFELNQSNKQEQKPASPDEKPTPSKPKSLIPTPDAREQEEHGMKM